jgi:hypothetical protein
VGPWLRHDPRVRRLAVVVLPVVVLVACSEASASECARGSGGAKVCLLGGRGHYEVEGTGLKPGSVVATTLEGHRSVQGRPVGDDGRWPGGGHAFAVLGTARQVTVDAVAADGERLHLAVGD